MWLPLLPPKLLVVSQVGCAALLREAAKEGQIDLVKILLEWMAAYGSRILFVHIFSHTGEEDPLSIGNEGADRMAVAGAKAGRSGRVGTRYIALRLPRPCGPTPPPL